MTDDVGSQFIKRAHCAHLSKRVAQRGHNGLGRASVSLQNDYTGILHTIPVCCRRHGWFGRRSLRGVESLLRTFTDGATTNPRAYFRPGAFSAWGSNGSAWSLPFCLSKISTLPSASSSSLRQAEDSCIPSSKRVNDFSRGTSPFSNSWTIFSRRSRHSSNFGKEACSRISLLIAPESGSCPVNYL